MTVLPSGQSLARFKYPTRRASCVTSFDDGTSWDAMP